MGHVTLFSVRSANEGKEVIAQRAAPNEGNLHGPSLSVCTEANADIAANIRSDGEFFAALQSRWERYSVSKLGKCPPSSWIKSPTAVGILLLPGE